MSFYSDALALVEEAIKEVLRSGAGVSYLGRSWTSANLEELEALRDKYAAKVAVEEGRNSGRNRILYVTPLS